MNVEVQKIEIMSMFDLTSEHPNMDSLTLAFVTTATIKQLAVT